MKRYILSMGLLVLTAALVGCSKPAAEPPVAAPPAAANAPVAGSNTQAPTDALGPRAAGAPGNEQPPPGVK
jgi:hypothetical protein